MFTVSLCCRVAGNVTFKNGTLPLNVVRLGRSYCVSTSAPYAVETSNVKPIKREQVVKQHDREKYLSRLHQQSVMLPGPERIRVSCVLPDPTKLFCSTEDNISTVYDIFLRGVKETTRGDCLGTRDLVSGDYKWISYKEVLDRSHHVGAAIVSLGLPKGNNTFVGISSKNRAEFALTTLGLSAYSMVMVPLFETYALPSLQHIINLTELKMLICDSNEKIITILKNIDSMKSLRIIVTMDPPTTEIRNLAQNANVDIFDFKELEGLGRQKPLDPFPPKNSDIFSIFFTSGTTGEPKGVIITHQNVAAVFAGISENYHPKSPPDLSTALSYLPMAHVYEMLNIALHFYHGGRVGFYSGDLNNLIDDMKSLKPSFLPLVPRVMNRVYQKVFGNLKEKPLKKALLNFALSMKEKEIKKGILRNDTIWDKLVFKKIRAVMGDQVEYVASSSAPASKEVLTFFRCVFGCHIFEVYGQTETLAATATLPYDSDAGSVGPPICSNRIKLVDVPEMNYFAENDCGEICVQGANVCKGYYKNPQGTAELFDKDGWLHTGDVGKWLPNGALKIIDRKKQILKLSQGEHVAPEKSENIYSMSELVLQIFVEGQSDKDFLIGILVPDPLVFIPWANKLGFGNKNMEDLCNNQDLRIAVLKNLLQIGNDKSLNSLEQIKNIYLHPHPFTVEDRLITPTQKLQRIRLRKKFESVILSLYTEGPLIAEAEVP